MGCSGARRTEGVDKERGMCEDPLVTLHAAPPTRSSSAGSSLSRKLAAVVLVQVVDCNII
jgi:hypothetical protein